MSIGGDCSQANSYARSIYGLFPTISLYAFISRATLCVMYRFDDIDFEGKVVYVRHTVGRIIGQGFVETEPKTRSSRRTIVFPGEVLEALKAHRLQQDQMRVKAGENWREQELVFCNRNGGFRLEWYTVT